MAHATLNPAEMGADLRRLDDLIAVMDRRGNQPLLLEHLHAARIYLLGAMPDEYALSLEDAKNASARVNDPEERKPLLQVLDDLLSTISGLRRREGTIPHQSAPPRAETEGPPGARSKLWGFFRQSDTSFGVFYPRRHIVAIFRDWPSAERAREILRDAGFAENEAMAISGPEMLEFLEEFRSAEGLWGSLMAPVSRLFGTEEVFVDEDIEQAHKDAGFLAVLAPSEVESARVVELVSACHPLTMRRYDSGGIVSLI